MEARGKEETLWEGRPSQWVNLGVYALCLLTCVLIVPLFIAAWRWLKISTTRYELTSERILLTTGVFSKQLDELELYRVRDIRIVQSFWLRLVGAGDVVLTTSDQTTPTFTFRAVKQPRNLSDAVRTHVEACRQAKGVREFDVV